MCYAFIFLLKRATLALAIRYELFLMSDVNCCWGAKQAHLHRTRTREQLTRDSLSTVSMNNLCFQYRDLVAKAENACN